MGKVSIDKSLIKEITKILKDNNLSEITIKQGFSSITVARNISGFVSSNSNLENTNLSKDQEKNDIQDFGVAAGSVTAPMVGTLYVSSTPGGDPFIKVGDKVKEGDQLFIIEAMKTMNPVRSPFTGKVIKILAKNEAPIEFGEILAIVEEDKK